MQDDGQLTQAGREVPGQLLAGRLEQVQDLLGLLATTDVVASTEPAGPALGPGQTITGWRSEAISAISS